MSDIQVYAGDKAQELEAHAIKAENLVLADDEGCKDAIDLHGLCDDTMAQIDSMVMLQNKPHQDVITENNKIAQTLKDLLVRAKEGFHKAIGVHLSNTKAQRMKSGSATAYFRTNEDKIDMEIDESKLPKEFFKRQPDKTAIKRYFKDRGKVPKGVKITETEQEPTLIFKEVK